MEVTDDELRDLMLLHAADALEGAEHEAAKAHLASGSLRAIGALAEAHEMLARLSEGMAPVAAPPRAREKLLARIGKSRMETIAPRLAPVAPPPPGGMWSRIFFPSAVAAAIAALITGGMMKIRMDEHDVQMSELQYQLADTRQRLESTGLALDLADRTLQFIRAPDLHLVELKGAAQRESHGRIFWDKQKNQWLFFANSMQPPGSGKTYELWYITADQKKIRAGTFDVSQDGEGSLALDIPADIGPIAVAAVTDEPAGGVDQPTGSIQMAGKIQ